MTQSMTGFFAGDSIWSLSSGKKIKIYVELKSLNSRFFELNNRIPSALSSIELSLTTLFKQHLVRGKIFFSIKLLSDEDNFEAPILNLNLLDKYLHIGKTIELKTDNKLNLSTLPEWINLPKLIMFESENLHQDDFDSFLALSKTWLEKLIEARTFEGSNTEKDLISSMEKIAVFLNKISVENDKNIEDVKIKIEASRKTMNQLKESIEDHSLLLEQKKYGELEFALDKNNINEELVRTKLHIDSIQRFFSLQNLELGKKLEFTLQELVREINTISSKNNNFIINTNCVEIKVELEKMKEQSQNIV